MLITLLTLELMQLISEIKVSTQVCLGHSQNGEIGYTGQYKYYHLLANMTVMTLNITSGFIRENRLNQDGPKYISTKFHRYRRNVL